MLKAVVTAVLLIVAGAASKFLSDRIRAIFESPDLTPQEQLFIPLGVVAAVAVLIALIEADRVRPLSWPWHRFWYMYELSRNGATSDRALRLPGGESVIEVLVEGSRREMVGYLSQEILEPKGSAKRFLILGESGSGKTVAMRQLKAALASKGRWSWRQPIPVLVRMSEYQSGTLLGAVSRNLELATKGHSGKVLGKSIDVFIRKGQVALLFDALDETGESKGTSVLSELEEFSKAAYRDAHLVVTDRTSSDRHRQFSELSLRQLEVQELSEAAVGIFVDAFKPSAVSSEDMWRSLRRQELVKTGAIGRNPFWLELIVKHGVFAEQKAEILLKSLNEALEREWDKKGQAERTWKRVESLDRDDQLRYTKLAVARLAHHMAMMNVFVLSEDDAHSIIDEFLAERLGETKLTSKDVTGLCRDVQILESREAGRDLGPSQLRFRHNLLLQFLAVYDELGEKDQLTEAFVGSQAANIAWWQTLFLADDLLRGREEGTKNLDNHQLMVDSVFAEDSDDKRVFLAFALLWRIDEFLDVNWDGRKRVTESMLQRTADGANPEQVNAASSIAALAPSRFVSAMERLLEISSPTSMELLLRKVLSDQLTEGLAAPLLASLLENHQLRWLAKRLSVNVGSEFVEPLIDVVRNTKEFAQVAAIEALGEIGDRRAAAPLADLLPNTDGSSTRAAVWSLGEIGEPTSIPSIIGALERDPDDVLLLAPAVSEAIAKMGDPAIAQLIAMLDEEEWGFYVSFSLAPRALVSIGQPTVEPLIGALHSKSASVQKYAAKTLGEIGDARAAEPLANLAVSATVTVSLDAFIALGKLGPPAVDVLVGLLAKVDDPTTLLFTQSVSALVDIGEPAVDPLLTVVRHDSSTSTVRRGAVQALGEIGDRRAYDTLVTLLKSDPDKEVRRSAAESLGLLGDREALGPLREALDDAWWSVQLEALISMSRLRSEPATEQLYTQIETGYESLDNEKNLFVRHIIASKMAAFEGERLYPYLEDLLSEIEAPPLSSNAKEKCLNLHVYVAKILAENSSVESWLLSYLQRIAADAEALGTTKGNRIARDARELIAELEEVKEED